MLGLPGCVSVSPVAVHRLLIAAASLLAPGVWSAGSIVGAHGLAAPWHVGPSPITIEPRLLHRPVDSSPLSHQERPY